MVVTRLVHLLNLLTQVLSIWRNNLLAPSILQILCCSQLKQLNKLQELEGLVQIVELQVPELTAAEQRLYLAAIFTVNLGDANQLTHDGALLQTELNDEVLRILADLKSPRCSYLMQSGIIPHDDIEFDCELFVLLVGRCRKTVTEHVYVHLFIDHSVKPRTESLLQSVPRVGLRLSKRVELRPLNRLVHVVLLDYKQLLQGLLTVIGVDQGHFVEVCCHLDTLHLDLLEVNRVEGFVL